MRFCLCVIAAGCLTAACGSYEAGSPGRIVDESSGEPADGLATSDEVSELRPRFVAEVTWSAIPRGSQTLSADVDGDGTLDLTATDHGLDVVGLASGMGDGTFNPNFVAHADRLEAAFGHVASGDVDMKPGHELVYLSTRSSNDAPRLARVTTLAPDESGAGFVARVSDYMGYAGPFALGDLDGDGQLDIFCAYAGSNAEPRERTYLQALYGNGDGTFRASEVSAPIDGITTAFVRLVDSDGDGRTEALLAGHAGNHGVLAVVDPTASSEAPRITSLPIEIDGLLAVDVDDDERSELVVLDVSRKAMRIMSRATHDDTFEVIAKMALEDPSYTLTGSLVAADFDDDGLLDLALAGNDTRSTDGYAFGPAAFVFHGDGHGSFKAPEVLQFLKSSTEFGAQVLAQDFDGDDQVDLGVVTYDATGHARVGVIENKLRDVR